MTPEGQFELTLKQLTKRFSHLSEKYVIAFLYADLKQLVQYSCVNLVHACRHFSVASVTN